MLRIGTATRDITPAYPLWLQGYGDRNHKSTGISEPINIGCLAIGNRDKTVLIITCDLCSIPSYVCEELYTLLQQKTGIAYPDLLICCSHTHFASFLHMLTVGPSAVRLKTSSMPHPLAASLDQNTTDISSVIGFKDPDPRFVADFKTKLIEAAQESIRNMSPGRLETVRVHVPQVSFNRRTVKKDKTVKTNVLYPEDPENYSFSPTDTELSVMRVTDDTGVKAVLANFGCHPVTGGDPKLVAHYMISPDYPFYLRQTVMEHYKCPVFFTLGSAGDSVPINRFGDCRKRIGSILGNSIILAERRFCVDECPEISTGLEKVPVKTIIETDARVVEKEYEQVRSKFISIHNDSGIDPDSSEYRGAFNTLEQKTIALSRSRVYPENTYTVNVQFLKIGRTVLVALPFEVFSETSLKMKAKFPDSIMVSCAGGCQGYLPPARDYERGGYEASDYGTHFEPGTADRLLKVILERLGAGVAQTSGVNNS